LRSIAATIRPEDQEEVFFRRGKKGLEGFSGKISRGGGHPLTARAPRFEGATDSQVQLSKFHDRVEKNQRESLAFQENRSNRISYPCLSTGKLLEKASESLKS